MAFLLKIMKKLLLSCLLASGLTALSGCASDEPRTSTTSTQTEESTVTPAPVTSTTTEQTTVHPASQ
jgi:hypothetical protein